MEIKRIISSTLLFCLLFTSCKKSKDIDPGTYNFERRICKELLNIDVEFDIYEGGATYSSANISIEPEPVFSHKEFLSSKKTEVFARFEDGTYIEFLLSANGVEKSHKVFLKDKGSYNETITIEHSLTSKEKFDWKITGYGGTVYVPLYEGAIIEYNNIKYKVLSTGGFYTKKIPNTKTCCLDSHIILGNNKLEADSIIGYIKSINNRLFTPRVRNLIFRGNYDERHKSIHFKAPEKKEYDFTGLEKLQMVAIEKIELESRSEIKFILPEGQIDFYVDMENERLVNVLKETNYVRNIYSYDSLDLSQYDLTNSYF